MRPIAERFTEKLNTGVFLSESGVPCDLPPERARFSTASGAGPRNLMRAVLYCHSWVPGTARFLAFLALFMVGLAGCASKPPADDPDAVADYQQTNDPLEPTNRVFYAVNNGLDTVLLRPAAQAYRYVVPGPVREGLHHVAGQHRHAGATHQ